MKPEDEALERLAQAVADGRSVDWNEVDHEPGSDSSIKNLRMLARIRDVSLAWREVPAQSPAPPSGSPGQEPTMPIPASAGGRWLHLEIKEPLGGGAFGTVHRAYDPGLDQDVALKLLAPDRLDARFLAEAAKLAKVRHPHVLSVYGAREEQGQVGIWTELIRGKTLETLLGEQGRFGAEEAGQVGLALTRALAAVHAAGLVHGDVKTQNIMREDGGRIVLLDFSVARAILPGGEDRNAGPAGTLPYMAPELFRGEHQNIQSDVYALGVLLFRLVTGRFPVEGRTFGELLEKHRRGDRLRLRDLHATLPAGFLRTIETAMAPDPKDRFRSMAEVEEALHSALSSSPRSPDVEPEPREPKPGRWRWAWLAAVAAALGILLWAVFFAHPEFRADVTVFRHSLAGEVPLEEGGLLRPGDKVSVEVATSRPGYLYVLNQDARGEAFLLFPLPGLDTTNPLGAGRQHRLPGSVGGTPYSWDVTSEGGTESLVIVASPRPVPEVEAILASLGSSPRYRPAPLRRSVVDGLRGLGGMSPSDTSTVLWPTRLLQGSGSGDVRVWELRYRNPVE